MRSFDIVQVLKSTSPLYKPGDLARATVGWREYAIIKPSDDVVKIKALPGASPSTYLCVLGLTGLTAYFGLYEVGEIVRKGGPNCMVVVSGRGEPAVEATMFFHMACLISPKQNNAF
ncbi:hypothetical protein BGZ74_000708 [Mortierella antarctica]|nr:hypothetical protein BGZ74_000708 [Mortierella antarctica]